ncbi:phosphatidate cytidylyltransferase [Fulvimonas soli]|jgi:phosphatidate cytidylyltransferase|uniref:Phosphatidate cytidylyltransferase n=1 Tax=Fulvimonas soli TaxID=155197 RepID=A0A316IG69_9GAMM|nr:phosphatidate cytidylyltransferase [Fulvimonas soli]PWK92019.1 phosphatidate cytidylyltransferase [Fulvimonas soli]TNY25364.1 phosphatidate cytidylyltransferase [Fulvimonas soli]
MLRQRILTALLLAPLAILLILAAPTWLFAPAVALVFLGAAWEWSQLSGVRGDAARGALLAFTAAVFALLWCWRATALWPALIALGVAWWGLTCLWLRHFAFGAAPTAENRGLKLLAGLLVIVPGWVAATALHGAQPHGHWWTFLALAIVWAADTGAYFSGRRFGRRKLAPNISPGKTWAGVYGAFAAGALVALAGGWLLGVRDARLAGLVLLAVLTVAASIVGDLLESLMKRHAQVKDSGTLFPGHGGLLDRLDSVFAAMPVFALGKLLLGL